jgi:hypothetical protein
MFILHFPSYIQISTNFAPFTEVFEIFNTIQKMEKKTKAGLLGRFWPEAYMHMGCHGHAMAQLPDRPPRKCGLARTSASLALKAQRHGAAAFARGGTGAPAHSAVPARPASSTGSAGPSQQCHTYEESGAVPFLRSPDVRGRGTAIGRRPHQRWFLCWR